MIERLNRAGKIYLYPIGHAKKGERKNQSQCARLIDKQLETIIFVPCYLDRASSFHFYCNSISNVFVMRLLQCEFCLNM